MDESNARRLVWKQKRYHYTNSECLHVLLLGGDSGLPVAGKGSLRIRPPTAGLIRSILQCGLIHGRASRGMCPSNTRVDVDSHGTHSNPGAGTVSTDFFRPAVLRQNVGGLQIVHPHVRGLLPSQF